MKKETHPKYVECKVTCGCGNAFVTRSTQPTLAVEVCSNCHPFFTGQQKFIDTAGRVEKFQKKYQWSVQKAVTQAQVAAKEVAATQPKRKAVVIKAMPSLKPNMIAPVAEGAKGAGAGAGGRMGGGGPGGAGGPGGGGRGGAGGGRGGRGGRGGKREAPVSTERQRTKPRAVEAPKTEAPQAAAPAADAPAPEAPKAEGQA
jgi:large subunit ribosomal protein L31